MKIYYLAICAALALAACESSTGTTLNDAPVMHPDDEAAALPSGDTELVATEIDPNAPTQIVVYRGLGAVGLMATAQPKIRLNGSEIGACRRADKIVVAVAPGDYTVSMRTDINANAPFTIQQGQTVYVRCTMLPIGIFLPAPALKIVSAQEALERVSSIPLQVSGG